MLDADTALDAEILFEPRYSPHNRRLTYKIILRFKSGYQFNRLKLKFRSTGAFSIQYPADLAVEDIVKTIVRRAVDIEIMKTARKLDTGSIEDMYQLGSVAEKASWEAFKKQINLE